MSDLNKTASAFVPRWLKTPAAAAPTPAPAAPAPAAAVPVAPVPVGAAAKLPWKSPATQAAAPSSEPPKLSAAAAVFVPKPRADDSAVAKPVAAPKEAPKEAPKPAPKASPKASPKQAPTKPKTPAQAPQKPVAPSAGGAWAKGAPKTRASPAAKPAPTSPQTAPVKQPSPQAKPTTPQAAASKYTPPASRSPAATPKVTPSTGEVGLHHHSKAEAEEISKKSTLKVAATSFIPSFKLPAPTKTNVVTQKSPMVKHIDVMTSVPPLMADANGEVDLVSSKSSLPLSHEWTLHYVDTAPPGTEQFDPFVVYQMKNLETFWRTFNNVPSVTHLPLGSTYFLFKDGIEPKWEDPKNIEGGAWSIRFMVVKDSPDLIDQVWERLCCRAVGDSWDALYRPQVNGLVAKMRERHVTLQIWVSQREDEFPSDILRCVDDIFPAFSTNYVSHMTMYESAAQRDKERQQAKKKGKKGR